MNHQAPQYYCILVAAGTGHRMGINQPKQYLDIAGRTLLEWSVQPFLECPQIRRVVVVLSKEDNQFSQPPLASHPKITTVPGGQERYQSVLSGLNALSNTVQGSDWVMVHDAARPNLSIEDALRLIRIVKEHPVGGILGTPVTDSLKVVNHDNTILTEAERNQVWRAFTPQMFRFDILLKALTEVPHHKTPVTDDAAAVGRLGYQPLMIRGRSDNIKVTTQEDYEMVKKLMLHKLLMLETTSEEGEL